MSRQIVTLCTFLVLLAVPSHEQGSQGSTPTSPCPKVFMYDPPGSEPGSWSGVKTSTTDFFLHSTWLNIILDSHATNLQNWLGSVTTEDGVNFIIENDDMQIHPGHPVLVPFFIKYDPLNTIPRLREIRLTGEVICLPEPKIWTNLDMEPVQTTLSKPNYPEQKPVNNNFIAAFNPDNFSNTSTTTDECGEVTDGNDNRPLIHNGKLYERGKMPWLVAIYIKEKKNLKFICVGTLVSNRHVITAAHCIHRFREQVSEKTIVVKVGIDNLDNAWVDDNVVTAELMAATIHKKFKWSSLENDITILTLNKRVEFNNFVRPACLWSGNTELSRLVGDFGVVASWHNTESDDPQMLQVPIVSTQECRASHPTFDKLTSIYTLCAGSRDGTGPCTGDSGGGLYVKDGGKWKLRGVVSVALLSDNGNIRCNLNEYIVYTDTAQYLPWIRNILSQKYYD